MTCSFARKLCCKAFLIFVLLEALVMSVAAQQPPRFVNIQANGSQVMMSFTTEVGVTYYLEYTDDLNTWQPFGNPVSGSGTTATVSDNAFGPHRLYRLRADSGGGPSVYSVNVVGYVNLSLHTSANLIANPLIGASDVPSLFPLPPSFTDILKVGVSGLDCITYDDLDGWIDCASGNPANMTVRLGQGLIVNSPQNFTQIFVGEMPAGLMTSHLPAGYSLCSSIVPQAGLISSDLGFPSGSGGDAAVLYKFDPNTQSFSIYVYDDANGFWDPFEPFISVGEAFWLNLSSARVWSRSFDPGTGGGGSYSVTNLAYSAGLAIGLPPAITAQPQSRTNLLGTLANFSVTAVGSPPLHYQWRLGNVAVAGATNATFAISNVQASNDGTYSVVVTNNSGSITSAPATLLVYQLPFISDQPVGVTTNINDSVTFSVTAGGLPAPVFQWRKNGINIPGATNSTLTIPHVQTTDGGTYTVVVVNDFDAIVSNPVLLTILAPSAPGADTFANRIRIFGTNGFISGTNSFTGKEPGEPAIAKEPGGSSVWYVWTAPISGIATFSTAGSSFDTLFGVYTGTAVSNLSLVVSDDDAGGGFTSQGTLNVVAGADYNIGIDGLGGATGYYLLQWNVEPTAQQFPVITNGPASVTVAPGASTAFTVTLQNPALQYQFQWFFNDAPISGATNQSLTLSNITTAFVGNYSLLVTLGSRSIKSKKASLQINLTGSESQPVLAFDKFVDAVHYPNPLVLGNAQPPGLVAAPKGLDTVARGYSGSQVFSSIGATTDPTENHCGALCGASDWLPFTVEEPGMLYLNTDGSSFDTVLEVYDAAFNSLKCDNNGGSNGKTSSLQVSVQPGQTYSVVVDGVGGAGGSIQLNYQLVTQASVTMLGRTADGAAHLHVSGHPQMKFQMQISSDAKNWSLLPPPITAPAGTYGFVDLSASNAPVRFYRALMLP